MKKKIIYIEFNIDKPTSIIKEVWYLAHQVIWNQIKEDEFVRIGNLTKDEEVVLRLHAKGKNRVEIQMETDIPLHTIDRIISRLKIKYDEAQKVSDILTPRKKNAKELYNNNCQ